MITDLLGTTYSSYSSQTGNKLTSLLTGQSASESKETTTSQLGNLLGNLLTPSIKNANALMEQFSTGLKEAMKQAGLSMDPPFELSADPNRLQITVTGDRDDLAQISELINSSRDLQKQYHNACAVASHAYALQEAMKFNQEYQESNGSAAIIAKYSSLFHAQKSVDITMQVGEEGSHYLFDGKRISEDSQDVLV